MSEPKTYKVELIGDTHYVRGLVPDYPTRDPDQTDMMLLYTYPEGDVDTRMKDAKMMHSALYDLFQCHDGLRKGDRFETEFGNFVCVGVHVVPEKEGIWECSQHGRSCSATACCDRATQPETDTRENA